MRYHKMNSYECPACKDAGEKSGMFCAEDGVAQCQQCGARVGDFSQVGSGRADLDLVYAGPLRGFKSPFEVSEALTSKPSPSDDPYCVQMRESVDKKAETEEAAELLRREQIASSRQRQQDARDEADQRQQDVREAWQAARKARKAL